MSVNSRMKAIADAIRGKTGGTAPLTLESMASAIAGIPAPEEPTIQVSTGGLITAAAGGKSKTYQLPTKSAATITPGTASRTISAHTYLTGTQTIKGDANLKPENIKSGVKLFGVTGTYAASGGSGETVYSVLVKNVSQYGFTIVAGGRSVTLASGESAAISLPLHSPVIAYDAVYNYPAYTLRGPADLTVVGCAAFLNRVPTGEVTMEVVD